MRRELGIMDNETADRIGTNRFARAMKQKLEHKRAVGRGGWNRTPANSGCSMRLLRQMLLNHVDKGDMVDIANLAMMIWNREHPHG